MAALVAAQQGVAELLAAVNEHLEHFAAHATVDRERRSHDLRSAVQAMAAHQEYIVSRTAAQRLPSSSDGASSLVSFIGEAAALSADELVLRGLSLLLVLREDFLEPLLQRLRAAGEDMQQAALEQELAASEVFASALQAVVDAMQLRELERAVPELEARAERRPAVRTGYVKRGDIFFDLKDCLLSHVDVAGDGGGSGGGSGDAAATAAPGESATAAEVEAAAATVAEDNDIAASSAASTTAAASAAATGGAGLICVLGKAGSGKTSLLRDVCSDVDVRMAFMHAQEASAESVYWLNLSGCSSAAAALRLLLARLLPPEQRPACAACETELELSHLLQQALLGHTAQRLLLVLDGVQTAAVARPFLAVPLYAAQGRLLLSTSSAQAVRQLQETWATAATRAAWPQRPALRVFALPDMQEAVALEVLAAKSGQLAERLPRAAQQLCSKTAGLPQTLQLLGFTVAAVPAAAEAAAAWRRLWAQTCDVACDAFLIDFLSQHSAAGRGAALHVRHVPVLGDVVMQLDAGHEMLLKCMRVCYESLPLASKELLMLAQALCWEQAQAAPLALLRCLSRRMHRGASRIDGLAVLLQHGWLEQREAAVDLLRGAGGGPGRATAAGTAPSPAAAWFTVPAFTLAFLEYHARQAAAPTRHEWHASIVAAYEELCGPAGMGCTYRSAWDWGPCDGYFFPCILLHLQRSAADAASVAACACSLPWLQRCLAAVGVDALLAAMQALDRDSLTADLVYVQAALLKSAAVLRLRPQELPAQLLRYKCTLQDRSAELHNARGQKTAAANRLEALLAFCERSLGQAALLPWASTQHAEDSLMLSGAAGTESLRQLRAPQARARQSSERTTLALHAGRCQLLVSGEADGSITSYCLAGVPLQRQDEQQQRQQRRQPPAQQQSCRVGNAAVLCLALAPATARGAGQGATEAEPLLAVGLSDGTLAICTLSTLLWRLPVHGSHVGLSGVAWHCLHGAAERPAVLCLCQSGDVVLVDASQGPKELWARVLLSEDVPELRQGFLLGCTAAVATACCFLAVTASGSAVELTLREAAAEAELAAADAPAAAWQLTVRHVEDSRAQQQQGKHAPAAAAHRDSTVLLGFAASGSVVALRVLDGTVQEQQVLDVGGCSAAGRPRPCTTAGLTAGSSPSVVRYADFAALSFADASVEASMQQHCVLVAYGSTLSVWHSRALGKLDFSLAWRLDVLQSGLSRQPVGWAGFFTPHTALLPFLQPPAAALSGVLVWNADGCHVLRLADGRREATCQQALEQGIERCYMLPQREDTLHRTTRPQQTIVLRSGRCSTCSWQPGSRAAWQQEQAVLEARDVAATGWRQPACFLSGGEVLGHAFMRSGCFLFDLPGFVEQQPGGRALLYSAEHERKRQQQLRELMSSPRARLSVSPAAKPLATPAWRSSRRSPGKAAAPVLEKQARLAVQAVPLSTRISISCLKWCSEAACVVAGSFKGEVLVFALEEATVPAYEEDGGATSRCSLVLRSTMTLASRSAPACAAVDRTGTHCFYSTGGCMSFVVRDRTSIVQQQQRMPGLSGPTRAGEGASTPSLADQRLLERRKRLASIAARSFKAGLGDSSRDAIVLSDHTGPVRDVEWACGLLASCARDGTVLLYLEQDAQHALDRATRAGSRSTLLPCTPVASYSLGPVPLTTLSMQRMPASAFDLGAAVKESPTAGRQAAKKESRIVLAVGDATGCLRWLVVQHEALLRHMSRVKETLPLDDASSADDDSSSMSSM